MIWILKGPLLYHPILHVLDLNIHVILNESSLFLIHVYMYEKMLISNNVITVRFVHVHLFHILKSIFCNNTCIYIYYYNYLFCRSRRLEKENKKRLTVYQNQSNISTTSWARKVLFIHRHCPRN